MEIKVTKEALYAALKPGIDKLTLQVAEEAVRALQHSSVVEKNGEVSLSRNSPTVIANQTLCVLARAKPLPDGWHYADDCGGDLLLRNAYAADEYQVGVWRWPDLEVARKAGRRPDEKDYRAHHYRVSRRLVWHKQGEQFALWFHGQVTADLLGDKSELVRFPYESGEGT